MFEGSVWRANIVNSATGGGGGGSVTVGTGNPSATLAANGNEGDLYFNKSLASLFIIADVAGKKWINIV